MTTILTTTGISLYLNTRREYKTESPTDDQMRQYLRTKPEPASAEANSLIQIVKPGDHLVFLCTETPNAQRCAELLKEFFTNRGFKHIRIVRLQFQEKEEHIEAQGLRDLVNSLIREIEEAQRDGQEVVINATAGFKAQIVYSTMIGMIYHVPVKYIYETFQRIVTFNPIALDWDTSLFLTYNWFFQWLDEEPRSQREVEERLRALPDSDKEKIQSMLTSPDENGDIFLSPMGEALRQRFARETEEAEEADWPPTVEVKNIKDKIANSIVKQGHNYPKGTKASCEKIARLPYVQSIIGDNFVNSPHSRINHTYENGIIELQWTEDGKAARLIIHTTAQGHPQTRKVAEKIREILGI
jgi:putative CRISPR-associated protein (TIGR02619 family)